MNLTAAYSGPAWFAGSSSATSFTVTRAATRTALHPSAAKIRYGHENAEKISVVVTPAHAGPVTGTVTVKAGSTTICRVGLKSGKGACVLSAKRLRTGGYTLTASYGGSADFTRSSAKARLTIAKQPPLGGGSAVAQAGPAALLDLTERAGANSSATPPAPGGLPATGLQPPGGWFVG